MGEDIRIISITSFLIAAKMCQDKSPLIDNLVYVLDLEDQISITKEKIISQEAMILKFFGFDLNFVDPISFIERYMRLLD